MVLFGYVRKNYPSETPVQIKDLMAYGCQDLFVEKEPLGIDDEQKSLLKTIKKGDAIIVTSLVSFGKSGNELHQLIKTIAQKEVRLVSLNEKIDTSEKYLFSEVLTVISVIDKKVNGDKIKHELVKLKKSGQQLGRPPLDEETIQKIKDLRYKDNLKLREIAKKCGISIGTVYKYIN